MHRDVNMKLWADAVDIAVFILNRTGTNTVKNKTPYEVWYMTEAPSKRSTYLVHRELQNFTCREQRHSSVTPRLGLGYERNLKGELRKIEKNCGTKKMLHHAFHFFIFSLR